MQADATVTAWINFVMKFDTVFKLLKGINWMPNNQPETRHSFST
jgi:hypothetical protein